jgi:nitrilase
VLSANQCVRRGSLPEWISEDKSDEEGPIMRGNARKTSAVTEEDSEIVLPLSKEKGKLAKSSSGALPEETKLRGRKTSVIIENGHEIILPLRKSNSSLPDEVPLGGSPGKSHGRKRSIAIENGHEIALPLSAGKLDLDNAHAAASTVPGRKKSEPRESSPSPSEFVSRGGSCIVSPFGEVLAGPLWENNYDLLVADVDFDDCLRGRLDLDVAGSYSRLVFPRAYLR